MIENEKLTQSSIKLVLCSVLLLMLGMLNLHGAGGYSPYSLVLAAPYFFIISIIGEQSFFLNALIASMPIPVSFYFLVKYVHDSDELIPKSSIIAFAVIFVCSIVHAINGWEPTVLAISSDRALLLVLQSLLLPSILIGLAILMKKKIINSHQLFLHWVGYAWLIWSAFPWYGELI